MKAYFKKFRAGWGIVVKGYLPLAGESIVVQKRDGSYDYVKVRSVFWSGQDRSGDDVAWCSIERKPREAVAEPEPLAPMLEPEPPAAPPSMSAASTIRMMRDTSAAQEWS